jgi:anti-sigma B factor antagonist
MTSPFEVTIEERDGAVYVTLLGELDISTAGPLEDNLQRIEADEPRLLVIDLSRLDFMDSTGLRILISADQRARADGRRCVLIRGNDIVQRVLRLTGLDERLDIVDEPGALASA